MRSGWRRSSTRPTAPETPVEFKIKELLNTEELGYTFNDLDFNKTFSNPYVEADKPERQASDVDRVAPLNLSTSQTDAIYKEMDRTGIART